MTSRLRFEKYCFTLNNYTPEDERRIQESGQHFTYCIYGREQAETTGTLHLQGYVHFKSRLEFSTARAIIGGTAHIERARGSDYQNKIYCSKSGDYWEYGTLVQQGERTDLTRAVEICQGSNGGPIAIARNCPEVFVKYYRGFERLYDYCGQRRCRDFKTKVN